MRNTIAYPLSYPTVYSPSLGITCSYKRGNDDRVTAINFFTRNGGNAIPKHAGPEGKVSNPTTGLTLLWVLWARNAFRGNYNHWQVSRKEAQ